MQITEPTTMLTDYLVAALSFYFWRQLRLDSTQRQVVAARWWSRAFLATAVGALAGGTSHGFATHLGETGWLVFWKLTIYSLAGASLALLLAALHASFGGRALRVLTGVAWIKFGVYCLFMLRENDFDYVIYDYGSSMAIVLLLQLAAWYRHHSRAAPWIFFGILVSAIASQIQMRELGFHRHFNHNDLFHIVQMVSLGLFYRGGLLLEDAGDRSTTNARKQGAPDRRQQRSPRR